MWVSGKGELRGLRTRGPRSERVKLTIYVKDRRLRADGISVNVFREVRLEEGWTKAETNPDTARLVEASILTKARELRIGTLGSS